MALTKADKRWITNTICEHINNRCPNQNEDPPYVRELSDYDEIPAKHGDCWSKGEDHCLEASFRRFLREEAKRQERTESSILWRMRDRQLLDIL